MIIQYRPNMKKQDLAGMADKTRNYFHGIPKLQIIN